MKQVMLGGGKKSARAASSPKGKKNPPPVQKRRRRHTGRQTLNYLLLMIVAAVVMLTLSMTVLFHVKTVITDGATKYAPQALIEACGVKEGDNLLRVSERAVRKRILEKFPYVEDVTLKRSLPDKLVLQISEATLLGACETEAGYVILGETGRIIEAGAAQVPADVMTVYGMYLYNQEVGRILGSGFDKDHVDEQKKESDAFNDLTFLVEAVQETGFDKITLVDFSDSLNMAIVYDGRVLIELGSVADLSYKLQFASYVLSKHLPENFQGVIDASYCTTSNEMFTSSRDIQQELELRRQRAQAKAAAEAQAEGEDGNSSQKSSKLYPDLNIIPEKSSSGQESSEASSSDSGSSAGSSSDSGSSQEGEASQDSSQEQSSEQTGLYRPEDLAVYPTKPVKSPEESSSDASTGSSGAQEEE